MNNIVVATINKHSTICTTWMYATRLQLLLLLLSATAAATAAAPTPLPALPMLLPLSVATAVADCWCYWCCWVVAACNCCCWNCCCYCCLLLLPLLLPHQRCYQCCCRCLLMLLLYSTTYSTVLYHSPSLYYPILRSTTPYSILLSIYFCFTCCTSCNEQYRIMSSILLRIDIIKLNLQFVSILLGMESHGDKFWR
jgi:hypothetical protein